MGGADLGFQAIGLETMREYWPVFAAAAAIQVWVVRRIQGWRRFRVHWIALAAMAAALVSAFLWAESFLVTQFTYQTVGQGAGVDTLGQLQSHALRSWPPLAACAAVLLVLAAHPRSAAAVAGLVAVAGVLVSWVVAMWLFTTNHMDALFRVLVLPGGLGVVASLVGFTAATAAWMAIGRWVWKQGRRRRGITSHADGNLPQLRR